MGILKRCGTCGQLVDWDDLAEAVHHGQRSHRAMPGFSDDRAIQLRLPLEREDPAGWAAHLSFEPTGAPAHDARKGRRKKGSFEG